LKVPELENEGGGIDIEISDSPEEQEELQNTTYPLSSKKLRGKRR